MKFLYNKSEHQRFVNRFYQSDSELVALFGLDETPYYSVLNPVFSRNLKEQDLTSESHYFLRDGLLELIGFFLRFPGPRGIVIVPLDLSYVVPKEWKDSGHISYYQFQSKERTLTKNKKLLLYDHVLFPRKNNLFESVDLGQYDEILYFHSREGEEVIGGHFSTPIKTDLEAKKISKNDLYGLKADIYYLNDNLLFFDSYLQHQLAHKGGRNIEWGHSGHGVSIGPYHEVGITLNGKEGTNERHKDLMSRVNGPYLKALLQRKDHSGFLRELLFEINNA